MEQTEFRHKPRHAGTVNNKQLRRDSLGRFVSNNRDPHTSAPNPPAYSNTSIPVDPPRTTSQLSSQYEFITSQPTTPFTNTPALPNIPLPPDTSPPPSPTLPSKSDVESEPKLTKTPGTEEMAAEHVMPFHGDKEDERFSASVLQKIG